jgi:hypothetical protein
MVRYLFDEGVSGGSVSVVEYVVRSIAIEVLELLLQRG